MVRVRLLSITLFILVTGAAGNVGTELVKQLSTVGAIFRAGVHANKSADKIGKISSRAQLIEMDYDKPETLRRACDGVSKISPYSTTLLHLEQLNLHLTW